MQDLAAIDGGNKVKREREVANPRKIYALEDVHAVARRLLRDDIGNKAVGICMLYV